MSSRDICVSSGGLGVILNQFIEESLFDPPRFHSHRLRCARCWLLNGPIIRGGSALEMLSLLVPSVLREACCKATRSPCAQMLCLLLPLRCQLRTVGRSSLAAQSSSD